MEPNDTTAGARRVQLDVYRRMAPSARIRTAVDLSEQARIVALAGIAGRDPALTALQREEVWRSLLDRRVAARQSAARS